MQGWTGMIYTFLKAKKEATAVAFQKRAEVPGFHRSYWQLYQQFPNRIQIVVLKDAGYVCPQPILDRHNWLEKQFQKKHLERPYLAGDKEQYNKYLTVALVGRKFQGETSVIAMNGGIITTALAALETGESPFNKIKWTVYEAWRVNDDKSKTLLHYARENPSNQYLQLVQQNGMLPSRQGDKSRQDCACHTEPQTADSSPALPRGGVLGNGQEGKSPSGQNERSCQEGACQSERETDKSSPEKDEKSCQEGACPGEQETQNSSPALPRQESPVRGASIDVQMDEEEQRVICGFWW